MEAVINAIRPALTEREEQAITLLTQPLDALSQHLSPEQMLGLMQSMTPVEQLAGAMDALAGNNPPMQPGPDGWLDLTAEDRRLVQRIINQMLSSRD
jgi:hypothetical protein